jgi:hypothetical protein
MPTVFINHTGVAIASKSDAFNEAKARFAKVPQGVRRPATHVYQSRWASAGRLLAAF